MSLLLPISPTGGKGGVRGKRGTPEKERLPLYYVNNPTMRLTKSSEKSLRKRIDPIAAINSALRLVELLAIEERLLSEAPRPQGGASRARSGKQNVSKGSFIHIVPLDPAYPALAGRGTFRPTSFSRIFTHQRVESFRSPYEKHG